MNWFQKLFKRPPLRETIWIRDDQLSDKENEQNFNEALINLNIEPPRIYPKPMQPPWEVYPDYPMGSMGWKMGSGEDYMIAFLNWFDNLDAKAQKKYVLENSEPSTWKHWWLLQTNGIEAYKAAEAADRGAKT